MHACVRTAGAYFLPLLRSYDPRGGDPTVVFAVSPLSANVDNAYLRAIGANIVAATNLLEVDDDEAGASHFFRQVGACGCSPPLAATPDLPPPDASACPRACRTA